MTNKERITENNNQLQECIALAGAGGGGGGGSGIIDVTELPTENIDENAVYRVTKESAQLYAASPADGMTISIEEFLSLQMGADHTEIVAVEELENVPLSGGEPPVFYIHVLKSTGVGYINIAGEATTLSAGLFGGEIPDKGWIDDISSATELGIYAVVGERFVERFVYLGSAWVKIEAPIEDLKFILNGDGVSYSVAANHYNLFGTVEIPAEYNGLPVTEVAINGFKNRYGIEKIILPSSVKIINDSAFRGCAALKGIVDAEDQTATGGHGVTVIDDYAFYDCCSLVTGGIPVNLKTIGDRAFGNCVSLKCVRKWPNLTSIEQYAFDECVQINATAETASLNGFSGGGAGVEIPQDVMELGWCAFSGNISATIVRFLGQPSLIDAQALNGMRRLEHIYVPWAEGAVANAPWGAPDATIHYNTDTSNM